MFCYNHLHGNTISSVDSRCNLSESVIAHNCTNRTYAVFPSHDELLEYIGSVPRSERTFHEVIIGAAPQKLKLDLDMSRETVGSMATDYYNGFMKKARNEPLLKLLEEVKTSEPRLDVVARNVVSIITEAAIKCISLLFGENIDLSNFAICSSTNSHKWSFHIIIDGWYVPSNLHAQVFMNNLRDFIPEALHKAIDWGVNKSVQNLRLIGCHKYAADESEWREKVMIKTHTYQGAEATLVTFVEDSEPFNVKTLEQDVLKLTVHDDTIEIADEVTEEVVELMSDIATLNGCRFRDRRGKYFNYDRYEAAYCDHCTRDHHNDNTMIVTAQTNEEGTALDVYYKCRHNTESRAIYIGSVNLPTDHLAPPTADAVDAADEEEVEESWHTRQLKEHIKAIANGARLTSKLDTISSCNRYCEPELRPFELKETLCVDAAMKMGKTKNLLRYIDEHFSGEKRIMFLSFRITFTSKIVEQFVDFISYRDVEGVLNHKKLIVQLESLHRIDMATIKPLDLLILDECESIIEQLESGNHKSLNKSFAVFEWLLRESKHIICLDANIGDRTEAILRRMRPSHPIFLHHNTYCNATSDKYNVTADKNKWLGILEHKLRSGEKVSIPCNSKEVAKSLHNDICRKFPGLEVMLYTSETSQREKNEHFADVDTYWSLYDVIIYTPTVTAGVSFERVHFNSVFGYFTHASCPAETCIQMLGRVRAVISKNYYLMFDYHPDALPTSSEEIVDILHKNREMLFAHDTDASLLTFSYDKDCNIVYHNTNYVHLWAENRRIANLSRNDFARRMMYLLAKYGSRFSLITDDGFVEEVGEEHADYDYAADHITEKIAVRAQMCEVIAAATDIDEDEAYDIKEAVSNNADVPRARIHQLEKYELRRVYKFDGLIDDEFVNTYRPSQVQRKYKNICAIMRHETDIAAINYMRDYDRNNHSSVVTHTDNSLQPADVQRSYYATLHRIAGGMLEILGFKDGLRSTVPVDADVAREAMLDKTDDVIRNAVIYCNACNIRRPYVDRVRRYGRSEKTAQILMGAIRSILLHMYGYEIKKARYIDNALTLVPCDLFVYDDNNNNTKPRVTIYAAEE